MTFKDFMLKTAYGTQVQAIVYNREDPLHPDKLTCTPASYFNAPIASIQDFAKKYNTRSVHGIRIDTVNGQPTVCVNLYPD